VERRTRRMGPPRPPPRGAPPRDGRSPGRRPWGALGGAAWAAARPIRGPRRHAAIEDHLPLRRGPPHPERGFAPRLPERRYPQFGPVIALYDVIDFGHDRK